MNAKFKENDIRGLNHRQANLRQANFTRSYAGLPRLQTVIQIVVMSIGAATTGVLASFGAIVATALLSPSNVSRFSILPGAIVILLTLISLIGSVIIGFVASAGTSTIFLAVLAILSIFNQNSPASTTLFYAPLTVIQELIALWLGSVVVASAQTHSKLILRNLILLAFLAMGTTFILVGGSDTQAYIDIGDFVLATSIILTANIISYKSFQPKSRFLDIAHLAVSLTAIGGTSFQKADLSEANFSFANLKHTDFRGANLKKTYWYMAKGLEFSRLENTYLANPKIRQLVVTLSGKAQKFDGLNLEGVNLKGAKLENASFIGTNLNYANLQNADLSKAILKQTQLDGTDFTGATLTGAFIEDWNITTDTLFDGVRCEYVYMRLPTPDNPDPHRKPDNRQEVFGDGEFGDFIKPIFDTLDLYHNQGVDPRAIAISFKQLAENHPEADLRIVGMEVRGEDKFLLRAKTVIAADKSQLSAEYFATYNQLKALAEQEVKALIAEKDGRIADLQNMVVTALQRPSFYSNVEQVGFMTNNPGGFSVGGSVDGDINNVQGENNQQRVSNKSSSFNLQGAQFAGGLVNADTVNAHQIGGNITNYTHEQRQNLAEAAAEIQELLNQLGQTYPTNTPLEKQIAVTEVLKQIDSNPTLKARVIGALKYGGTEALKELVDHPLVNILLATLEGWQDAE